MSRTSPGIMSPADSFTTSPGTSLLERNFLRLSVAHRRGGDLDHRLELGRRVVGLRFLNEPQRQLRAPPSPPSPSRRCSRWNFPPSQRSGWRGSSAESPADCARRSKAGAASSCCFSCATSLGPYSSSRAAAASSLKPVGEVPNRCNTADISCVAASRTKSPFL